MARPVILCVDADPLVLADVERELAELTELTGEYRLVTALNVADARGELRRIGRRSAELALLLIGREVEGGAELVAEARESFPHVRTVALCRASAAAGAADTAAVKDEECDLALPWPWVEGRHDVLGPVADLLDDWRMQHGGASVVRVVGHRWSRRTHEIRSFLSTNLAPFKSLDVETSPTARRLVTRHEAAREDLPLVLLNGQVLRRPDDRELAEAIGLQTRTSRKFYEMGVVGAGPAGLAAAMYGASEGLSCAVLEASAPGGQAGTSARIENYLGFPQGLTGADLTRRAVDQARRFGAELAAPRRVVSLRAKGAYRFARTEDGYELACHALVLACGVVYRQLECPGMDTLTGYGVYYGATRAEAHQCAERNVFIVGGGNSAAQAAVFLSDYAQRVTLLVREPSLEEGMSQYLVDRIRETPNIEVRLNVQVAAVHGDDHLEALTIEESDGGKRERLEAHALYLFIGATPNTDWLKDSGVLLDREGFVLTGRDLLRGGRRPEDWRLKRPPRLLETSIPGVFAAGDVRAGSVKRVASAVGDGSMAVQFVHEYLEEL